MSEGENLLFVGGPAHGAVYAVTKDARHWNASSRPACGPLATYDRVRWATIVDGRERYIDLMAHGSPDSVGVASAMSIAWMREHGHGLDG